MAAYTSRFALILALFAGLALPASGQCSWDTNGAVPLTINGIVPSTLDPIGHGVTVGLPFQVSIGLTHVGGPAPFVLVAGTGLACGALPVPWGGAIDVSGAVVVGDGINPAVGLDFICVTDLTLSLALPPSLAGGSGPGFQIVHPEPAAPPYFLDNSEAGEPVFQSATTTSYSMGDDDWAEHVLQSTTVVYGGVARTRLFIGSNGVVTFDVGVSSFNESTASLFAGWQGTPTATPNPGVAVAWSDLNRGGQSSGASYDVIENPAAGLTTVAFTNQNHWSSQEPAGSFSVTFGVLGPNSLQLDHVGFVAATSGADDVVVGVTDGDDTVGVSTIADLSQFQSMNWSAPQAPASVAELFAANSPIDLSITSFFDQGDGITAPFHSWTIF